MDPLRRVRATRSMLSLRHFNSNSNERLPPEPNLGSPPPKCLHRIRVFTLVVNTANMINDRMTRSLGRLHAILAPVTFFAVAIFMTCFLVGACCRSYGSQFLQVYALIACGFMECFLAYTVFSQLTKFKVMMNINLPVVLNGVLPIINALLMGIDVVVMLFSRRTEITIEDTT